jgi:muramoyltetrapeptide carboxypeptidase
MSKEKMQRLVVPPFLKTGDTVGVATPASPYDSQALQQGLAIIRQWGFKVVLGREKIKGRGYLAGTDRERAEELNDFFVNPEIKAILCSRGGYGAMRLLEYLDFKKIKGRPKLFMGFSDITVLLAALLKKTGLMTFHGPMVAGLSRLNTSSLTRLQATLRGHYRTQLPLGKNRSLRATSIRGVLLGGNLTMLAHLIGTPFEPAWDKAILFLEDCGEEPYRLDRLFMHLRLRGCLERVSAILLGQFSLPQAGKLPVNLINEIIGGLNIPVWTGLPIGHGPRNIPLPIGAPASIDAEKGVLTVGL